MCTHEHVANGGGDGVDSDGVSSCSLSPSLFLLPLFFSSMIIVYFSRILLFHFALSTASLIEMKECAYIYMYARRVSDNDFLFTT